MLLGRLECLAGFSSSGEVLWKSGFRTGFWVRRESGAHSTGIFTSIGAPYTHLQFKPTQVFRNLNRSYSGEICESKILVAHNMRTLTMLEPWSWFEYLSSLAWILDFLLVPWSGTQPLRIIFLYPGCEPRGLRKCLWEKCCQYQLSAVAIQDQSKMKFSSSTSGVDYFKETDILLKKGAHTLNLSRVLAQA